MKMLVDVATLCSRCGAESPSSPPPSSWSLSVQDEHRTWTCASCTRADLFRIEARLSLP
ncbi:MAG: hypothetical protein P8Z68_05705 [Kineosporiaceae bacterium]|jgi:hypothetical protein